MDNFYKVWLDCPEQQKEREMDNIHYLYFLIAQEKPKRNHPKRDFVKNKKKLMKKIKRKQRQGHRRPWEKEKEEFDYNFYLTAFNYPKVTHLLRHLHHDELPHQCKANRHHHLGVLEQH